MIFLRQIGVELIKVGGCWQMINEWWNRYIGSHHKNGEHFRFVRFCDFSILTLFLIISGCLLKNIHEWRLRNYPRVRWFSTSVLDSDIRGIIYSGFSTVNQKKKSGIAAPCTSLGFSRYWSQWHFQHEIRDERRPHCFSPDVCQGLGGRWPRPHHAPGPIPWITPHTELQNA